MARNIGHVGLGAVGAKLLMELLDHDGDYLSASGSTDITIYLRTPSGVIKEFAGSVISHDSKQKVGYVTEAEDDLDEEGVWTMQGVYTQGSFTGPCGPVQFSVFRNLAQEAA